MNKIIKIDGMHCSHCSARVMKALSELGVSANIDLSAGTAEVSADVMPDDSVLRTAVEDLGFDVISIK